MLKQIFYYLVLLIGAMSFVGCERTCPDCEGKGQIFEKCQECNGRGKIKCSTCHGDRILKCSQCGGSGGGYSKCTICNGEGYVFCLKCKGTGRYQIKKDGWVGNTRAQGVSIVCPECKGERIKRCPFCEEKGPKYHECIYCHGRGKYVCYTCKGDAWLECTSCTKVPGYRPHGNLRKCPRCKGKGKLKLFE